jgi:hypothetical protein
LWVVADQADIVHGGAMPLRLRQGKRSPPQTSLTKRGDISPRLQTLFINSLIQYKPWLLPG